MGNKGGLPSVPRGLAQELTLYLQALDGLVRRMAGMTRGTGKETAVAGSAAFAARPATSASASGAAGDIGTGRLADGAVGTRQLKRKAVTTAILDNGAVSPEKIADGVLPEGSTGAARHGEEVNLGAWAVRPALCVAGFDVPAPGAGARLSVGFDNLRHDGGAWRCSARACAMDGTGKTISSGIVYWQLIGRRA